MPSISQGLTTPGVVILPSFQSYCFCGYTGVKVIRRIEALNLVIDSEWKILPLDQEVIEINSLVATTFNGNILVFGGQNSLYPMMLFTQEAQMVQEFNLNEETPGFMYRGCVKHFQGKIYASGRTKTELMQVMKIFNGVTWNLIDLGNMQL